MQCCRARAGATALEQCQLFDRLESRAGAAFLKRLRLHLLGKKKRKGLVLVLSMTSVKFIDIHIIKIRILIIRYRTGTVFRAQNDEC